MNFSEKFVVKKVKNIQYCFEEYNLDLFKIEKLELYLLVALTSWVKNLKYNHL